MRSTRLLFTLLVLCLALVVVKADVYINSPRGSNNRLDEANRDRDNGDRLFDSQNNNRGGYNVGQVYYYTGSQVLIEWTAQHSCGDKTRQNCELILQYSCDDRIRDGTTTTTIPTNPNQCYNYDCDTDIRYGRHESFKSYELCRLTQRNKGLFIGSQNLNNRDTQRNTRQNPGGTRRGFECPEERDYYPNWTPSIWRDIAVLTNDPDRCDAYVAESQNVKSRYSCTVPDKLMTQQIKNQKEGWIPITQSGCEALSYYDTTKNSTVYGKWQEKAAWGIPAPACRENQWSRDNHHGNVAGSGGFAASYNWTIPTSLVHERCVLRLRYNISTGDTIEWEGNSIQAGKLGDYTSNPTNKNGNANRDPANLAVIWERFKLNYTDVADSFKGIAADNTAALKGTREYVLKNNPRVDMFGPLLGTDAKAFIKTQLAINTAQFGRTFQDRTHRFAIRQRPANIDQDAIIHNLQVRGKRGNIVQVYPGVEYDFTPNRLNVQQGDYVHFQWTGSNTNPHNNAGNGLDGTDRSNLVVQQPSAYDDGATVPTLPPTKGGWGVSYPGRVDDSIRFAGLSLADQAYLGTLQAVSGVDMPGAQFGGHMDQFDDAGTYFDLGPRQVTQAGIYHYISTRNNAFSNRSQKGKLVVSAVAATTDAVGRNGGTIQTAGAQRMTVPAGALSGLQLVTIAATPRDSLGVSTATDQASDFILVSFDESGLTGTAPIEFTINYDSSPLHKESLKRASSLTAGDWDGRSGASIGGGTATVSTLEPGVYVITSKLDGGAVAGIVIGCVAFFVIVGVIVWKVYARNKGATFSNKAAGLQPEMTLTAV